MNNETKIDFTKFYNLVVPLENKGSLDIAQELLLRNGHVIDEGVSWVFLEFLDNKSYNYLQISTITNGWWLGPKFMLDKEITFEELENLIIQK